MKTKVVVINHNALGMKARFRSLADAELAIRSCGEPFANTQLREVSGQICDEQGNVLGYIHEVHDAKWELK